jgi:hypothetical protein
MAKGDCFFTAAPLFISRIIGYLPSSSEVWLDSEKNRESSHFFNGKFDFFKQAAANMAGKINHGLVRRLVRRSLGEDGSIGEGGSEGGLTRTLCSPFIS